MAMAHVSSSAGSAYLRNSSPHPLVSAAELTSKYLVDGFPSAAECPPSSTSSSWHVGSDNMHFLSASEAPMKMATTGAMSLQQQAAANFGPEVLNAMPSSNGGEWQQFVDLGIQSYSSSVVLPASSAPEAPSRPVSYVPSSSPTQGIDKAAANAWGALTVDPSKGGLALQAISPQCFAEFPSDPGFAERAARYSSFGYQSPSKQLSRTSSLRGDAAGSTGAAEEAVKSALEDGKIYNKLHKVAQQEAKDDSMSSAQNSIEQGTSSRKRKLATDKDAAAPARKDSKNGESDEGKAATKRQKGPDGKDKDEAKAKTDKSGSDNSGSSSPKSAKENAKPPEAPKQDYIHVRARRGQATDSHSLAERVRREKISERMKFLQDLVPGCSKVTGKAVMLDEIINYVQSLQRQVEFLSMKLAAVNPRLDLNLDGLLAKEALHGRSSPSPLLLSHDMNASYTHLQQQLQHAQQQLGSCGLELRSLDKPAVSATSEAFAGAASQLTGIWDGELQSVVQMFGLPTPQGRLLPQELQGHLPAGHMKVEI